MHIHSYSTVYALGHRAIQELLNGPVIVEEKVDGSQFSMTKTNGDLVCRSKGQDLIIDAPEKMFYLAVETAKSLDLKDGWVYRCEYLNKPKHNTLAYSRVPKKHLVIYDVETGPQCFLSYSEKKEEALRLGLEVVPLIYEGKVNSLDLIKSMIDRDSYLGGCKIEGVVLKNYSLFTADKKMACAKLVCDEFKEKNQENWKSSNPRSKDVIQVIISALKTEARWAKAVQHLRDAGHLTDSPKDIGALVKEAQADIEKEEKEWISDQLLKHALPQIIRASVAGLPQWYKRTLAEKAFKE